MRDHSILQGIKELRGDNGNFRYKLQNGYLYVYRQKGEGGAFVFETGLKRVPQEPNYKLYNRTVERLERYK